MATEAIAYKYYRLIATKVVNSTYLTVNEFKMYEQSNTTSANLSIGAKVTVSSSYASGTAKNLIDGSDATYWASALMTAGNPEWFVIELASPKVVRAFEVKCITSPHEAPRDYKFQGSHDSLVWTDLFEEMGNTKGTFAKIFSISVTGVSKLDSGLPSLRVFISDWITGVLLEKITPNNDGTWSYNPPNTNDILVTHIGPSGYEPKSDGPITPYSW